MSHLTVSRKWLLAEADRVEANAKDALPAWTLLGTTDRYSEAMEKVCALRNIADATSVAERRERLRGLGYAA
ncbi:hypothetical protein [Burkholderia ubonensis]|uniref:hypothetical protein n=1 Tax=Burkholderia ubonensis TaxID=101571 RepID=UPI000B02EF18|nr:hypothetical protein [Burkholderia ubonensis]